MIEALKSDEIVHKMGGKFKLCALVQHRGQSGGPGVIRPAWCASAHRPRRAGAGPRCRRELAERRAKVAFSSR